jgi:hypothetical protein
MMARWLPVTEWPRLVGTELETVYPHLPPTARVWAVERGDAIVACGAFFDVRHHEGLWVRAEDRRSRDVWALVAEMLCSSLPFVTGSVSPAVARLIARMGGEPLPGQFFQCSVLKVPHGLQEKVGV